jgi:hypothetical protein
LNAEERREAAWVHQDGSSHVGHGRATRTDGRERMYWRELPSRVPLSVTNSESYGPWDAYAHCMLQLIARSSGAPVGFSRIVRSVPSRSLRALSNATRLPSMRFSGRTTRACRAARTSNLSGVTSPGCDLSVNADPHMEEDANDNRHAAEGLEEARSAQAGATSTLRNSAGAGQGGQGR